MKRNLILAALALLATLANAQDITGDWQGTIKAGMGELRLVPHVAKNADGTLKALVDSPDQNAPRVPIDSMTLEANKVRFSSAALKASYEGTLKSGDSINGSWTQGQKLPLDFKKTTSVLTTVHKPAAPSDIDGKWEGALATPQGKLRLVFHLQNTEDGLRAMMDSPYQKLNGWPATSVIRKGSSIKIEMKQVSGYFQGKIGKDPNTISGDWSQRSDTPLQLKRSKEESSTLSRKQRRRRTEVEKRAGSEL